MQSKLILFSVLMITTYAGRGQFITPSVINAGGQSAVGPAFSIDWSIGEMALVNSMELPKENWLLTNGFLQPEKTVKPQAHSFFAKDEVTVLPNPTTGPVEIWINTKQQGYLAISVHDAAGKEVYQKKSGSFGSQVVEKIDLTGQPAGTYFINIGLKPLWGFQTKQGGFRIVKM